MSKDINLLPENLRLREKKEQRKLAKRSARPEIELTFPRQEKLVQEKESKKGVSWLTLVKSWFRPAPKKSSAVKLVQKVSPTKIEVKIKGVQTDEAIAKKPEKTSAGAKTIDPLQKSKDPQTKLPRQRKSFWSYFTRKFSQDALVKKESSVWPKRFDFPAISPLKVEDDLTKISTIAKVKSQPKTDSSSKSAAEIKARFKSEPTIEEKLEARLTTVKPRRKLFLRINLLPQSFFKEPQKNSLTTQLIHFAFVAVFILLLTGVLYLGLMGYGYYIGSKLAVVQEEIAVKEQRINFLEGELAGIFEFQEQLKQIDKLLAEHIYWTEFFARLEKYTVPNVYYQGLQAQVQPEMTLRAQGKNFTTVAQQLVALSQAKDFVTDASITQAAVIFNDEGKIAGVDFDLQLKLVDDIFIKE